jgi:hypothetical protein
MAIERLTIRPRQRQTQSIVDKDRGRDVAIK